MVCLAPYIWEAGVDILPPHMASADTTVGVTTE